MAFCSFGADAIGNGTPLPATLYAQLHTGDPGPDGDENVSVLVPDRVASTFGAAASGVISSDVVVLYTEAPIGDGETIVAVSLHDAASAGNAWLADSLLFPVEVVTGTPLRFPVGALRVRFS